MEPHLRTNQEDLCHHGMSAPEETEACRRLAFISFHQFCADIADRVEGFVEHMQSDVSSRLHIQELSQGKRWASAKTIKEVLEMLVVNPIKNDEQTMRVALSTRFNIIPAIEGFAGGPGPNSQVAQRQIMWQLGSGHPRDFVIIGSMLTLNASCVKEFLKWLIPQPYVDHQTGFNVALAPFQAWGEVDNERQLFLELEQVRILAHELQCGLFENYTLACQMGDCVSDRDHHGFVKYEGSDEDEEEEEEPPGNENRGGAVHRTVDRDYLRFLEGEAKEGGL